MRVLQSWLRDYLKFSIPPEVLVERLTMTGLEFENLEHLGAHYEGFVIGRVLEVARHPNADRLTVCQVDLGKETAQIVCGAPNVAAGQTVAVGLPGATVPHNQHDPGGAPFVLGRVTIRGVESSGMICSEAELGLGTDHNGIMVLPGKAKPGQRLATFLGMEDVAMDVEITPNRPDWLSHIGVAREIGVLVGRKPALPTVRVRESSTPIGKFLKVRVEDRVQCVRFAARVVRGVKIGPSPEWLQRKLRNVGLRPRNNVVDITNFVMLECGQPMHAFDAALLRGGSIVVRKATAGAPFTTLDGKEHTLPEGAVMVCDAEREVSVAGVMGGANSEIGDSTTDIVLESACWNPSSIRRTAKALGISSDASQRFERGADPNIVRYALDRAAQLVAELAGGAVAKGVIDIYPRKVKERLIAVRPARVNAVLGTDLAAADMVRALGLLDMKVVKKSAAAFTVRVPTYRVDVLKEIDLIEEIARVHGYDNIVPKTKAGIDFSQPLSVDRTADRIRERLIGQGFRDVITNPMLDERRIGTPGITPVRILNPLSKEMGVMRTSLLPGLLQVVAVNQNRGNADLRIFEIGHVFRAEKPRDGQLVPGFEEEERLAIVMTGAREPSHWSRNAEPVDLFDIKGAVADLLAGLGLDNQRFIPYSTSESLMEGALRIDVQGTYAGLAGVISKSLVSMFQVEGEVVAAELTVAPLAAVQRPTYTPLPRYPKVRRDVAFVLGADTGAESVVEEIRAAAGELLIDVRVFDVYQGKGLPDGKKSLAFALELMSREKTLTDQEIEAVVTRVVRHIEQSCGAVLRGDPNQHA